VYKIGVILGLNFSIFAKKEAIFKMWITFLKITFTKFFVLETKFCLKKALKMLIVVF